MERGFWSNALFQFADYIKVPFQLPPVLLGMALLLISALLVRSAGPALAAAAGRDRPGAAVRAVLPGHAAGADRHALYHPGGLYRAQPAGLGAGRGGRAAADRPIHRRSLANPGRRCPVHLPQGDPAADPAGAAGRADLQLHPPHDQPFGHHLPGHRPLAHRDRLDHERLGAGRLDGRFGLFDDYYRPGADRHWRDQPGNPAHRCADRGDVDISMGA